jgi:pimeloyl-ACP methyl ester carboxylesterase
MALSAPRSLPLLLLMLASLAACGPLGDPAQPIPTTTIAAPQKAERLVVVLPGRADDLAALRDSGMVESIQDAWPDADVVLAELAIRYYMDGQAPQQLHREVIAPAQARGYREIWLAGASLGGMGTLLYDRAYPGGVDGLVLLAPYLGDRPILREIMDAGGVADWDPGPPRQIDADNWQRELWRHIHGWSREPHKARNVWLAYGDRDRLRRAMPLLAPVLRDDQVLVRPGGHDWTVWSQATGEILRRIAGERGLLQTEP